MGRKTDLKSQIEALQKEYESAADDDDDDLEMSVEKDGQKFTFRGRHARKLMRKHGFDDDDQGAGKGDDQGDDDDEDQGADGKKAAGKDKAPANGHRYFR